MEIIVRVEGAEAAGDALRQAAREAITQEIRERYESIFERVRTGCQGQPVAEVKAVLRQQLHEAGMELNDTELSEYSEALMAGEPVTLIVNLPDGL